MTDDLFTFKPPPPKKAFNGPEYEPKRDFARLAGQMKVIFDLMQDGTFRTLGQIETATGAPQSSISAQLRHLRKEKWGSHTVNRKHLGYGHYSYQLIVNKEKADV